jgi:FkbM family methyltransferase
VIQKIKSGLSFIKKAATFSNPAYLVLSKILTKGPVLIYRYKQYTLVSCEIPCWDGWAIEECLIEKAYENALEWSRPKKFPGTYINIGAHVGAFDVAIHESWGGSVRGVSIEMNPWTCARLLNNICYNRLPAQVINAAVSDKIGCVMIDMDQSRAGQSIHDLASGAERVEIKTLTLKDIPDPVAGAPIDLLKVDCEGAEYSIFSQASPKDLERFKNIVMEIHEPPSGYVKEQLIKNIETKGGFYSKPVGDKKGTLSFFTRRS